MHTPTLTQKFVSLLFDQWQGTTGFIQHTEQVTSFYQGQCGAIMASCEKHLTGLATWKKPKAGMFLWLTVSDVVDTKQLIESQALANNVLLVPGQAFMPHDETTNTECWHVSVLRNSNSIVKQTLSNFLYLQTEFQSRNTGKNGSSYTTTS